MYRRKERKSLVYVLRVSEADKRRLLAHIRMCKAVDPSATVGDIVVHSTSNLARSARQQLRNRGEDPWAYIAAREPVPELPPEPFFGLPSSGGTTYNHPRCHRKPFKGIPDLTRGVEYD